MTLRFLLDTDTISEPLRPSPSAPVMAELRRHIDALATAAPVWHELRFGCERLPASRRRQAIEAYLERVVRQTLPILPYDSHAAEWHGRERSRLVREGLTPTFVDGQIAAIAAVNGLTLVTGNTRDYSGYRGLRVVSWRS